MLRQASICLERSCNPPGSCRFCRMLSFNFATLFHFAFQTYLFSGNGRHFLQQYSPRVYRTKTQEITTGKCVLQVLQSTDNTGFYTTPLSKQALPPQNFVKQSAAPAATNTAYCSPGSSTT